MLKLFEKYVLSDADRLYGEANQLLVATGVLPGLKAAPSRRPVARYLQEALLSAVDQPVGENGQEAFTTLQALLVTVRGSVAPILEASAEPQPIATRDLLRLLSHLQQYVPEPDVEDDFDLRNQLEQLLTRVSVKSGKSRVVEEADEDVINLIALLFEFIRNDRSVPDAFKALICACRSRCSKWRCWTRAFSAAPAIRRGGCSMKSLPPSWAGARSTTTPATTSMCASSRWCSACSVSLSKIRRFFQLLAQFSAFTADERQRSELLEQHTRNAEECACASRRSSAGGGCARSAVAV